MSSVRLAASEFENLQIQKKKLLMAIKEINNRMKVLEENVGQCLESQGQTKAKLGTTVFELVERKVRTAKPKNEKEEEIKDLLRKNGVHDIDRAYEELVLAQRGNESTKKKLVTKRLK